MMQQAIMCLSKEDEVRRMDRCWQAGLLVWYSMVVVRGSMTNTFQQRNNNDDDDDTVQKEQQQHEPTIARESYACS